MPGGNNRAGRGVFITFEGGEGAGKSTQVHQLAEVLTKAGRAVLTTREPGGSPGAEAIRALLVTGETGRWDAVSEALLLYAARRDHLRQTVLPALEAGNWVLCDRFDDSTVAYQGYGHGLPLDDLAALRRLVVGDLAPDLTFILDLSVEEGLARTIERGGDDHRFERMDREFHQRLRAGFLALAEAEPGRCRLIDAARPAEAVHAAILAEMRAAFPKETI